MFFSKENEYEKLKKIIIKFNFKNLMLWGCTNSGMSTIQHYHIFYTLTNLNIIILF